MTTPSDSSTNNLSHLPVALPVNPNGGPKRVQEVPLLEYSAECRLLTFIPVVSLVAQVTLSSWVENQKSVQPKTEWRKIIEIAVTKAEDAHAANLITIVGIVLLVSLCALNPFIALGALTLTALATYVNMKRLENYQERLTGLN